MRPSTRILRIAGMVVVQILAVGGRAELRAQECPGLQVINCGHRGTGTNSDENEYPENTIPSFLQGVDEGAQMVELDVIHSSDGALMVIHDDKVDRTTDGTGCVGDMTLEELRALDAAYGTPMEGTGVVIPTLAEVLDAVDVGVNIEIKINDTVSCPDSDRAALAADVVAAITADTKPRRIVVSSFDADALSEVQALDSDIHLGLLTMVPDDAPIAVERGFDALNLLSLNAREETVEQIHEMGLELAVWTDNDPYHMEDDILYGVEMVITDDPDLFESIRADYCARWEEEQDSSGGCAVGGSSAPDASIVAVFLGALLFLRRRTRQPSGRR